MIMKKDTTDEKKGAFKKYFLPAISIAATIFAIALVLTAYRPGRYAPVKITDQNQISPYLTHKLMPDIYNNAQRGEAFEVVIGQAGLNDIVGRLPQPIRLGNITLDRPQVVLASEEIIMMATVQSRPIDFFVTVELNPKINEQGLLNLHIDSIKLGALSITGLAKRIGEGVYTNWEAVTEAEPNEPASQICRSLLRDEPFEPVFEIRGNNVRISRIDVKAESISIKFLPVQEKEKNTARRDAL